MALQRVPKVLVGVVEDHQEEVPKDLVVLRGAEALQVEDHQEVVPREEVLQEVPRDLVVLKGVEALVVLQEEVPAATVSWIPANSATMETASTPTAARMAASSQSAEMG